MTNNWKINYELNLDDELHKEMTNLQTELDLLEQFVLANDLVKVKCALVRVRFYSLNLSDFFRNIVEDIGKVLWSDETKLPEIPEGYEIPESYNYIRQ